ncbi:carboxylesterase/lipase family protein [Asanoa iriomotensis]|uniref:Carboxylic ester hydrolase n=1 Tax=Asanoa iriomotensis TaxID=234613 RepID=A0ABQ4BWB2_9ACTN|nr:carboxylesterase family protein [Asanoa iriomotensis]GIF54779.1 hypothetical protein Air01nite_08740 [Asanoa iriomotensis]
MSGDGLPRDDRAWPRGSFVVSAVLVLIAVGSSVAFVVAAADRGALQAALVAGGFLVAFGYGLAVAVPAMRRAIAGRDLPARLTLLQFAGVVVAFVVMGFAGGVGGAMLTGLIGGLLIANMWAIRKARANRSVVNAYEASLPPTPAVDEPPARDVDVLGPALRLAVSQDGRRSLAWVLALAVVVVGSAALDVPDRVLGFVVLVGVLPVGWVLRRLVAGWLALRDLNKGTTPRRAYVVLLHDPAPRMIRPLLGVWADPPVPRGGRLPKPERVWIYGGAYVIGGASQPEFDGANLARDGGVVVVTFNYRLGVEGFAQITGAPPNRGLLDQVAALEWVRANIAAFGGDPEEVTVFGQSAGAGSIAALLAMPRAAGLFRRAVVQSMPGTYFSTELAADIASACAAKLGLRPVVADLADVDPELLVLAADNVTATMADRAERWGQPAHRSIPFAPVVDGEVLPTTPWQALAAGAGRDIDLLAGHTRDEHRLFTVFTGFLGEVTPEQARTALRIFGPDDGRYQDAGPDELYELVHSDWLFRMPTLHLAEAQVAGGGRAHFYELTWPAPGMGGVLGACHGLDVPLVFGNLTSGQPAVLIGDNPTAEAVALSRKMRAAWTRFASHGDPGWPAYDADRRLTQVFDTSPALTPYPEEMSRLIWQDHAFLPHPVVAPRP